ncbi:M14 family zinc carboxypeptidase [Paracoccus sp. Z330]|uniref:M14 family zinc carboxypeptidase n=1 Tax=Paracoccus onchidii TaxID=3017813 RepID=A0ABT4ZIY9_9RHOB|nr:M14 family zinc carboxypeptidase [Paracoccus onchidii]MDB6178695.1 M14 family zinc carboxypeptidase [Paracoccus onchidii]
MNFEYSPVPTLQDLVDTASAPFEAWTFDDHAARRSAEEALAAKGITARIRSAYKPLLHFFLEDVPPGLVAATIRWPVHEAAEPNRFLLESYPLAALFPQARLSFEQGDTGLHYTVDLTYRDRTEQHRVLAPNRVHTDHVGQTVLSPTGWRSDADGSRRLETDYEQMFHAAMAAIAEHDWGPCEPYFQELNIAATVPARDLDLGYEDEIVSLAEALHEDFYFSCLEFFQKFSGRPLGDRHLQPGQIVPEVTQGATCTLQISLRPFDQVERAGEWQNLDRAAAPLSNAQIRTELAQIGGPSLTAQSHAGRPVEARHHQGRGKPVMISAGQHANETTPVVGALRAAHRLAQQQADFVISPMENPDGYALHGRLSALTPRHMLHAARYTALGDDLEYREPGGPLYEKEIRNQAEEVSGAKLHVNLHGYPAHEWTRPLTGYIPRNFAMWTLPKGFFLVLRYREGWKGMADQLIDRVTASLQQVAGLGDFNARQIDLYRTHAGQTGFEMINGFPCYVHQDDRHSVPLTLITEYPDETVYGPQFVAGHEAQMQTVLAAHAAWQQIGAG